MPRRNGYVRPPKRHGRWISEPLRIFRRLVRERHVRGTRHTVPKERGNLIEESIIIQDWFGVNLRVHNRIPGQVGEQNELASVKIDNLSSGGQPLHLRKGRSSHAVLWSYRNCNSLSGLSPEDNLCERKPDV